MSDTPLHELSISRYIDAPPAEVWDILVNRQEEWWCPKPWYITIQQQDRRPGGTCAITMHGPDGEVMPNTGIYLLWEEGRRFATTDAVQDGLVPSGPFMIGIWEVAPEGSGTRYTARARHWTAAARDEHEAMGFTEGWSICADQLEALAIQR